MKKFAALFILAVFTATTAVAENASIWLKAKDGFPKAEKAKKLILVDIYTQWWGYCKKLDRDVLSKPEVQDYISKNFIAIKLDAEDRASRVTVSGNDLSYAELSAAYGVTGFPSTLFLESDGQLLYKHPGYLPPESYMKLLQYFGEREYLKAIEEAKIEEAKDEQVQ